METLFSWTSFLSLRAIYNYNFASHVPSTGSTTFADLSTSTSIPAPLIQRLLRPAMATHMFSSPTPSTIAHTASSRLFLTDPFFHSAIGLQTTELGPTSTRVIDAIDQYGYDGEPAHTAYAMQNGVPIFEVLGKDAERGARFGKAMRYHTKGFGYDVKHLLVGYDWASLDKKAGGATVVDIGGGHGAISQALARATTNMHFTVQDLPGTVEQATKDLPKELEGRIDFTVHDFFTDQQAGDGDADVYLLRWILHDWSDAYCVKILKALLPVLRRKEQRVILYEYVLPESPATNLTETFAVNLDMIMLACFNGAERTRADFEHLLHTAHPDYRIEKITKPEGSAMSILEVSLRGVD